MHDFELFSIHVMYLQLLARSASQRQINETVATNISARVEAISAKTRSGQC